MEGKDSVRIRSQIESSKGFKVFQDISHLERSYDILVLNFADVEGRLVWFALKDNAFKLAGRERTDKMDDFWLYTQRHLHNYLASATALRDHMRRLSIAETDSEFKTMYCQKTAAIAKSPLTSVVHDLRSYVQHNDVTPMGAVISTKLGKATETFISLNCAELLSWRRWSKQSRDYLLGAGDSLRLRDVLNPYQTMIADLSNWFLSELCRIHRQELDEFIGLHVQLQRLLPKQTR
jgi:hypothetical protein